MMVDKISILKLITEAEGPSMGDLPLEESQALEGLKA